MYPPRWVHLVFTGKLTFSDARCFSTGLAGLYRYLFPWRRHSVPDYFGYRAACIFFIWEHFCLAVWWGNRFAIWGCGFRAGGSIVCFCSGIQVHCNSSGFSYRRSGRLVVSSGVGFHTMTSHWSVHSFRQIIIAESNSWFWGWAGILRVWIWIWHEKSSAMIFGRNSHGNWKGWYSHYSWGSLIIMRKARQGWGRSVASWGRNDYQEFFGSWSYYFLF